MGGGIPCTLTRVNGEGIKHEEEEHERKTFVREFASDVKEYIGTASALAEKADAMLKRKGTMNAAEKKEFRDLLCDIKNEQVNLAFVSQQFDNFVDKSITEAKQELDAHVDHLVRVTGLETIRNSNLLANDSERNIKIEKPEDSDD